MQGDGRLTLAINQQYRLDCPVGSGVVHRAGLNEDVLGEVDGVSWQRHNGEVQAHCLILLRRHCQAAGAEQRLSV